NKSWFHHVDSSHLGRLEWKHNLAQCSCEVSLGAAPGTVTDYGDEESELGVSWWLKDIGLLDET
ncbi:hypothetical protein BS47DRAFT_1337701, partial [Hydnum rufescens UP504]